jgi:hypothetical protein
MAELVLHLDEDTAKALACAAERDHLSEAEWASTALKERLSAEDAERQARREAFLSLAGSWEDDRTVEQILADIKSYPAQPERLQFD